MTEEQIKRLLKLSGMLHKPGYYTAQEWEHKTGVNPCEFPKLIKQTSAGLCVWTAQAESIAQQQHTHTVNNWAALGVTNKSMILVTVKR